MTAPGRREPLTSQWMQLIEAVGQNMQTVRVVCANKTEARRQAARFYRMRKQIPSEDHETQAFADCVTTDIGEDEQGNWFLAFLHVDRTDFAMRLEHALHPQAKSNGS